MRMNSTRLVVDETIFHNLSPYAERGFTYFILFQCSTCPHCGKGCKDRTQLITHIELRHDEATCDVCEVTFYGKRKLLYHKVCWSIGN